MNSKWFVIPKPNPTASKTLICLPYAGGSASIYTSWADFLPNHVELVSIQPPGRANRMMETAIDNMAELVSELSLAITSIIQKPYVIFGHSLGSRVAFELIRSLKDLNQRQPDHFIASGNRPPHLQMQEKRLSELPKEKFFEELVNLDGTPREILQNQKLMALYEPILRADFKIGDDYRYQSEKKLECPTSIFGGLDDTGVSLEHLHQWQIHFDLPINIQQFNGDHFYLDNARDELLMSINKILEE
jgi:surfactin synthase thioesterase subunit